MASIEECSVHAVTRREETGKEIYQAEDAEEETRSKHRVHRGQDPRGYMRP
jgi:hypothetical protein